MAFWERCEDGGTLFSREGAWLAPASLGDSGNLRVARTSMAALGTILLGNSLRRDLERFRETSGFLLFENCIASTETFWILYVQVNKGLR